MEIFIYSFNLGMKSSLLLMNVFILDCEYVHHNSLDVLHFIVYFNIFDTSPLNGLVEMTKNDLTITATSKSILVTLLGIFFIRAKT